MRNLSLAGCFLIAVVGCHRPTGSTSSDPSASSEPVDAAAQMALGMADLTPTPDPVAAVDAGAANSPAPSATSTIVLPADGSVPPGFSLNINRSSCMGPCPQFDATIDAKGNIVFTGSVYANHDFKKETKGCATKHIGTKAVAALIAMLKKKKFFALREYYAFPASDQQSESVAVRVDGNEKNVMNDLTATSPAADIASIRAIESTLEQVTGASAFLASPKSMPCKR